MDSQELAIQVGTVIRELREEFAEFRAQVREQGERFDNLASTIAEQGQILIALVDVLKAENEIIHDERGRPIGVRKKVQ